MAGDDREPIGRKGKPANTQASRRSAPVRRNRRDDDYDDYEEEMDDDVEDDDDDYEQERESRMNRKAAPRKAKKGDSGRVRKASSVVCSRPAGQTVCGGCLMLLGIYGGVPGFVRSAAALTAGRSGSCRRRCMAVMVNLEPGMAIQQKAEMVGLLEGTQYREVTPHDASRVNLRCRPTTSSMLRRPFDFPDGKEGQVNARLMFDGNSRVANIENHG
jgi:penicillin-binding protein 1B